MSGKHDWINGVIFGDGTELSLEELSRQRLIRVAGSSGNDTLQAGAVGTTLDGGAGNDELVGATATISLCSAKVTATTQ